ncbi:hypothetical protein LCGC14_0646810 [marine sediment metagenome]|uniref:Nucleotidyl transferase domain-containing protein n=1 Tax=marine sediment metagenome TaxID=412755 RepID=A0A0F9R2Q1_9ZZZZ|nr:hypothetical protein [Pricia sp.]
MITVHRIVEKLAIGWPWDSPFIWTPFCQNLANLERPENSKVFQGRGWCPAKRHIHICDQAIEYGASHILIIGADQLHPIDMIPRLISRIEDDGCDVISALVPTRGHIPKQGHKPFQHLAWRLKGDGTQDADTINKEDGDLQQIDMIGSGVILFPIDAMLAIEKPWWREVFSLESMSRIACMDTRFCWDLKVLGGVDIWVDTTIDVRHLSTFPIDDTYAERFKDFAENPTEGKVVIDMQDVSKFGVYQKKEAV